MAKLTLIFLFLICLSSIAGAVILKVIGVSGSGSLVFLAFVSGAALTFHGDHYAAREKEK